MLRTDRHRPAFHFHISYVEDHRRKEAAPVRHAPAAPSALTGPIHPTKNPAIETRPPPGRHASPRPPPDQRGKSSDRPAFTADQQTRSKDQAKALTDQPIGNRNTHRQKAPQPLTGKTVKRPRLRNRRGRNHEPATDRNDEVSRSQSRHKSRSTNQVETRAPNHPVDNENNRAITNRSKPESSTKPFPPFVASATTSIDRKQDKDVKPKPVRPTEGKRRSQEPIETKNQNGPRNDRQLRRTEEEEPNQKPQGTKSKKATKAGRLRSVCRGGAVKPGCE